MAELKAGSGSVRSFVNVAGDLDDRSVNDRSAAQSETADSFTNYKVKVTEYKKKISPNHVIVRNDSLYEIMTEFHKQSESGSFQKLTKVIILPSDNKPAIFDRIVKFGKVGGNELKGGLFGDIKEPERDGDEPPIAKVMPEQLQALETKIGAVKLKSLVDKGEIVTEKLEVTKSEPEHLKQIVSESETVMSVVSASVSETEKPRRLASNVERDGDEPPIAKVMPEQLQALETKIGAVKLKSLVDKGEIVTEKLEVTKIELEHLKRIVSDSETVMSVVSASVSETEKPRRLASNVERDGDEPPIAKVMPEQLQALETKIGAVKLKSLVDKGEIVTEKLEVTKSEPEHLKQIVSESETVMSVVSASVSETEETEQLRRLAFNVETDMGYKRKGSVIFLRSDRLYQLASEIKKITYLYFECSRGSSASVEDETETDSSEPTRAYLELKHVSFIERDNSFL